MCVHLSEASVEALVREGMKARNFELRGTIDIKGKGPMRCVSRRRRMLRTAIASHHK